MTLTHGSRKLTNLFLKIEQIDGRVVDTPELERGRPRLGGSISPVEITHRESAALDAIADQLIPAQGHFPAASAVGITEFITRYITPASLSPIHYPFLGEVDLSAVLDKYGDRLAKESSLNSVVRQIEEDDAEVFGAVRDLVYFGYYSRPEIVILVRKHLPAGRDYHGAPQPYGYLTTTEHWDFDTIDRIHGSFVETSDVIRVDLSTIPWAQGDPAPTTEKKF